jgi:DNA processing protein
VIRGMQSEKMPETLSDDLRDMVALGLVPGLGPRLTQALLERFGSARAVLEASPEELREVPYIGAQTAGEFHQAMRLLDLDKECELIARHKVSLLARGSPQYPAALAEIADPPHLLYLRGQLQPQDGKAVGIVGSRHCSAYGKRVAERLAAGLVQKGYTVVSGLARGIDGCAHRGALQAGGRTVAVMAGGLSKIYPPEHTDLAQEVEAAGALLSEASMALQPMAGMFPARNRIISGLSRAVVIVEAAERSGALITAHHAAEQGRTVFAVPGPVDSASSSGTNALIRQGAILARNVDDILEELEGVAAVVASESGTVAAEQRPAEPPPGLDDLQRRLWDSFAGGPRYLDEVVQQLGLGVPQIAGALMTMEMKRLVRRLPGNRYERL